MLFTIAGHERGITEWTTVRVEPGFFAKCLFRARNRWGVATNQPKWTPFFFPTDGRARLGPLQRFGEGRGRLRGGVPVTSYTTNLVNMG